MHLGDSAMLAADNVILLNGFHHDEYKDNLVKKVIS